MLRVTIEIVPFGDEKAKRTIATYEIENRNSHYDAEPSVYSVTYDGPAGKVTAGFTHHRKDGADACVRAAMRAVGA